MRNILITGGSGFVGRNLIERLYDYYNLYFPTHKELDLLDQNALEDFVYKNRVDVIIHGAIHVGMFNGFENILLNDMIMFNNIEKISHQVDKVIYFGSGAEYDKDYDISMVSEGFIGKHIPKSDYGIAKYTMNLLARRSQNIYNLRLFGIFGKYELWDIKFISNVICKILYNLPVTIRKECKFDYLYIDDLVKVVCWCIENTPKYHDYNVCMGKPYYLSQLVEIVSRRCGVEPKYEFITEGTANEYTADNSRLCNEIGSSFITTMEEAVSDLIRYYRTNLNDVDYQKLKSSR